MTGSRIAGIAALASLLFGCTPPPRVSEMQRTLVLPLNVVAAMPRELIESAPRVDRIMRDFLAEQGKTVETIGFADAVAAWRAGESDCRAEAKKGCDRFARVAPFAARRLRTQHDYDVLIVPYLLLRGARTNGSVASFDGVERPVRDARSAPDRPYGLRGRIRAASLKVFGYSAEGRQLFDDIGGLDVVDQIGASDDPGAYTIEVRENALGDPVAIREGVARALHRLVPRRAS